jgi:pilus assembly protein Flp/PilA
MVFRYFRQSYVNDRRGVTAMEYGLIASLVAVVIIGTLLTLGGNLNNIFSTVSAAL